MEPEAQLIAAQAAEELARQQATGQVDEIQRARMAQQILGGAAQQAQAREARDRQAEFARRKRLGDVVAAGEAQKRLQDYQRETQRIGGMFQAGLGAASTLAAQGASYLAEQNALAEGLKAAEAEGGVQGAVDFLNQNPDYDPGEETLQRLYKGSTIGQQDAADLDTELKRRRFLMATRPLTPEEAGMRQQRRQENMEALNDVGALLAERQAEREAMAPVTQALAPFDAAQQLERSYRANQAQAMRQIDNQLLAFGVPPGVFMNMMPQAKLNLLASYMRGQ